jgi:hypothetical protein
MKRFLVRSTLVFLSLWMFWGKLGIFHKRHVSSQQQTNFISMSCQTKPCCYQKYPHGTRREETINPIEINFFWSNVEWNFSTIINGVRPLSSQNWYQKRNRNSQSGNSQWKGSDRPASMLSSCIQKLDFFLKGFYAELSVWWLSGVHKSKIKWVCNQSSRRLSCLTLDLQ